MPVPSVITTALLAPLAPPAMYSPYAAAFASFSINTGQGKRALYYTVDKLTHSIPYLTPKTKWLLMKIGKNFQDSLTNRGSGGRQIILTSALRSDESIKSLRRRNTNASENSAHRYGTTFDIAYNRYNVTDSTYFVPSDRLRILLGEVLYDLRKEHKCYIKYEIRQGCFHITAR